LAFLTQKESITGIEWQELHPDSSYTWLTEGMRHEFSFFLPLGTKETKGSAPTNVEALFKMYSLGVVTSRDEWVYDFSSSKLEEKIQKFIQNYNAEVFRLSQTSIPPRLDKDVLISFVDNFVNRDASFLKWTDRLKESLIKKDVLKLRKSEIRYALYRPFCKQFLYFDSLLNQRRYQQYLIFPGVETDNIVICVPGIGNRKDFGCLATNTIPSLDLAFEKTQTFPYYTYAEDGSNRRENITDWALAQFRGQYGDAVTKWDIFHYIYAMLYHPVYRTRYAENLKRDLPRIPLLPSREMFALCVRVGKALMELHLHYETAQEYRLPHVETKGMQTNWLVKKMKLTPSKDAVIVNDWLTLTGVPQECFEYRLGNRSALEWVLD